MGFRRFRRPISRNRNISPVDAALIRVRRLLRAGKFSQAGMILSGLAREAESLERRKVAAEFHSRAAHCFVDGGAEPASLGEAQAALRVFTNLGMHARLNQFMNAIIYKYDLRGMTAAIGTLRSEFGGVKSETGDLPEPPDTLQLPQACPQCGGPLRKDEVAWSDPYSAVCNYCGAVVQGKEN